MSILPIRGRVAIYNDFLRNKEYDEERQEYKGDTVTETATFPPCRISCKSTSGNLIIISINYHCTMVVTTIVFKNTV